MAARSVSASYSCACSLQGACLGLLSYSTSRIKKKPVLALSSLCVSCSPYFSPLNLHLQELVSSQLLYLKQCFEFVWLWREAVGSGSLKKVQIHRANKHSSIPHHTCINDLLNVKVLW